MNSVRQSVAASALPFPGASAPLATLSLLSTEERAVLIDAARACLVFTGDRRASFAVRMAFYEMESERRFGSER